jgi:hypothetical protein
VVKRAANLDVLEPSQTEDDFHLLFIERQIQAGTNADFKHAATRSGNNLPAILPELMLAHHQIEKRRQNPMVIEAHGRTRSRQRVFCRPSLCFSLASFVHTDNRKAFGYHAFYQKPRETCALMKSAFAFSMSAAPREEAWESTSPRADHSLLPKTVDGGNLASGLAFIRRMSA